MRLYRKIICSNLVANFYLLIVVEKDNTKMIIKQNFIPYKWVRKQFNNSKLCFEATPFSGVRVENAAGGGKACAKGAGCAGRNYFCG